MEKYNIELTVNACNECPFLNCSDTGDDCNILRQGIHESVYSNIDFKFDKGLLAVRGSVMLDGVVTHKDGFIVTTAGV